MTVFFELRCDVSSTDSIQRCFKDVVNAGVTKIDILVNNAGITTQNHPFDPADKVDRYNATLNNTNIQLQFYHIIRMYVSISIHFKEGIFRSI